jgi:hypothetical protein
VRPHNVEDCARGSFDRFKVLTIEHDFWRFYRVMS